MALFKIDGTIARKITSKNINLERTLQKLFEENLAEILDITFIAHEYSTSSGGRIDTLGIDRDGSPCIIEYKKNHNESVINQGLSYLRWLLDHKAEFEALCKKQKVMIDIDWDSSRVICVAESYNKFDKDTVGILPIQIELFRYKFYEGNILSLERDDAPDVRIALSAITQRSKTQKSAERLQKQYSVKDHLEKANEAIKTLFETLREKIVQLDEGIKEEPKKLYIAYKLDTNFVDVEIRGNELKVYLNIKSGQLNDPKGIARDLTKPKPIGHWGNGDYDLRLANDKELDYVFDLIKQSYSLNK